MSLGPFVIRGMEPRQRCIFGSFRPNGSSAVSSAYNVGEGFTVARTSAGKFTVTLNEVYAELVSATASVQMSTLADILVGVGDQDVDGDKTIIITSHASGVATDIASDADNRIYFELVVRKPN